MKVSRKRIAVALCLSLFGGLQAATAAPAVANEAGAMTICNTILQSTPALNVDLDNDGNPDVRAPRIYDVELCSDRATSFQVYEPRWNLCNVGWHPSCIEVRVTVLPVSGGASAGAELCFTISGFPRQCIGVPPTNVVTAPPTTMCIGFDVEGGDPCTR